MSTYFNQSHEFKLRFGSGQNQNSPSLSKKETESNYLENTPRDKDFLSKMGLCIAIIMCGLLTACITDATVDLTKAPFVATSDLTDATSDSISRLTDGTSQATTDLTEPTREFLSSTTPGAWSQADGTLNPDHKRIAFVVLNFDNLQDDIAHGSGEYLVSLARLVGVPPTSRDTFLKSAQNQYGYIFEEGQTRPESLRRLIHALHINSYAS